MRGADSNSAPNERAIGDVLPLIAKSGSRRTTQDHAANRTDRRTRSNPDRPVHARTPVHADNLFLPQSHLTIGANDEIPDSVKPSKRPSTRFMSDWIIPIRVPGLSALRFVHELLPAAKAGPASAAARINAICLMNPHVHSSRVQPHLITRKAPRISLTDRVQV